MSANFDMFAIVAPGLEEPCATELCRLGMDGVVPSPGGVSFTGQRGDLEQANLMLRTASRILVRLGSFRCRDFPHLFRGCRDLPWGRFVKPGTRLEVAVSAHRSRLIHRGRIAETVRDAVARALGAAESPGAVRQRIQLRLEDDVCTVSIDSSGELLHRRGYRSEAGPAPLRETLAAGILMLLGWDGREPLLDPMCGSATFLVEGALLAARTPPGLTRQFAFMHWPRFRSGSWQARLQQLPGPRTDLPLLLGGDLDRQVIERARRNAERAGVAGHLRFVVGGFADLRPPAKSGLVIANPPYGSRLGEAGEVRELYRAFGAWLRRGYTGWRFAFLAPDPELARLTGLETRVVARLRNGGLPVALHAGEL